MNFGEAIQALKNGFKVARVGWNGKGMWLILVNRTVGANIRQNSAYANAGLELVNICAHIDMFTAQGEMQPGWLASQADMLAEDWEIAE